MIRNCYSDSVGVQVGAGFCSLCGGHRLCCCLQSERRAAYIPFMCQLSTWFLRSYRAYLRPFSTRRHTTGIRVYPVYLSQAPLNARHATKRLPNARQERYLPPVLPSHQVKKGSTSEESASGSCSLESEDEVVSSGVGTRGSAHPRGISTCIT
jgi:hypothetical protein